MNEVYLSFHAQCFTSIFNFKADKMEQFNRSFLWRLLVACCILTALVILGGYLVAAGKLGAIEGEGVSNRVALVALASGLATAACLYPLFLSLHRRILRFADDVVTGNLDLARSLGEAIALRDSETGGHNFRVSLYAFHLAEALGNPRIDMRALLLGAYLHDIGKIGIHDAILLKPGRLSDDEMEVMRSHVVLGLKIIKTSKWLQLARNVIESHHERYDGLGYPNGLKNIEIPLEARIFAIVDVFDALTSERPYKGPMELDRAIACIQEGAGSQFDSDLVTVFCRIASESYNTIHPAKDSELEEMMVKLVDRHRKVLYDSRPVSPMEFMRYDR